MSQTNRPSHSAGFTLVEVLIIAPVVILAISGFVAVMIAMTSDVLVTRDKNNMAFETQDALDRIEQDTRLATQFLVTSGTFTAPQGSNNNYTGTAAFTNANSTLILGALTTDKNPADPSRQLVYYAGQPNLCGAQQSYNRAFLAKVMYFIKDGSLWRRAVLPDYNTNATLDDNTVCSAPWQRNTCSPGYSTSTRCQTNDTEVMQNIDTFDIKYFDQPVSTTEIGSSNALSASTIEVTINGKKVTAGRDITHTGSIRATKQNNIDVDLPIPGTPNVDAQASGTSIVFDWDAVPLTSSYVISYNINGGAWVDTTTNSQTTTYTVNANRTDTVTIRVSARNSSGTSPYTSVSATIPAWYDCGLQNGWIRYSGTFPMAGYTKTSDHFVTLKGLIKNGSTASSTVLCILPEGYRPASRLIFQTASNGAAARVDVSTTGEVILVTGGDSTWLSLNGINFIPSTAPYSWTALTLQNGWQNYGGSWSPMQTTIDSRGRVHTQGLVRYGTITSGTAITTLPVANRPAMTGLFPARGNTAFAYVAIGPTTVATRGDPGTYYSIQAVYYPSSFGGWSNLGLQNGWINYSTSHSTPQYTKASDGIVTVKGLIKSGATAYGTVIGTLPIGYRPQERLLIHTTAGAAPGRIDIMPNGNIVSVNTSSNWTSIEVSFMAEQ